MNGRAYYWLGVGSAFAAGVITGVAGVRINLERKLRKEYAEREELMQNAYEYALQKGLEEHATPEPDEPVEVPPTVLGEIEMLELSLDKTPNAFGEGILAVGGDIVKEGENSEEKVNPYHTAVEATPTDIDAFVEGAINEYGISYIDEEDYLDDDGRAKSKIDLIINGEDPPLFLEDGQPIDDWAQKVGDSIIVDFFKLVPPGVEPILYVRNHRTDEDYEVVRVVP